MQLKALRNEYSSKDDFLADFNLIVEQAKIMYSKKSKTVKRAEYIESFAQE
jgi:hypothetical protein